MAPPRSAPWGVRQIQAKIFDVALQASRLASGSGKAFTFIRHFHSFCPRQGNTKKSSHQASCIEICEQGYTSSTSRARAIAHRHDYRVCVLNLPLVTARKSKGKHEQKAKRYKYPVAKGANGSTGRQGRLALDLEGLQKQRRRRALYIYARKRRAGRQSGSRGKSSRRAKQDGGRRRLGGGGRHDGSEEGWWNCRRTCARDFGGFDGGY